MAIVTRRYALTVAASADLAAVNDRIPGTVAVTGNAGGKVVDVQFDDAVTSATSVDEFWADIGYSFIEQNPSTTAAQAFATLANVLALTGGTMAGNIALGGNRITGVPDTPTANTDAVNANFVRNEVRGLDPKDGARLRTEVDLVAASWTPAGSGVGKTLTSPSNATSNNDFDGVAAVVGNRILVTGAGVHSGVYTLTQAADGSQPAVLTRAVDFDESAEVSQGARLAVAEGDQWAGTAWQLVTPDPITVDATAQTWAFVDSVDAVQGGAGLTRTVNTLSVDLAANSGLALSPAGDSGQLSVLADPAGPVTVGAGGVGVALDPAGALEVAAGGLAARVDGTSIQVIGNQLVAVGGADQDSLHFGNGRVGSTTDTRYLSPRGDRGIAPVMRQAAPAPKAGSLRLYVFFGDPLGNGNDIVFTPRVNGVAVAAAAVTMASTDSAVVAGAVAAGAIASAGALVDIEVTKAASVGVSPRQVEAVLVIS